MIATTAHPFGRFEPPVRGQDCRPMRCAFDVGETHANAIDAQRQRDFHHRSAITW